jgi:hypothetical protein
MEARSFLPNTMIEATADHVPKLKAMQRIANLFAVLGVPAPSEFPTRVAAAEEMPQQGMKTKATN